MAMVYLPDCVFLLSMSFPKQPDHPAAFPVFQIAEG